MNLETCTVSHLNVYSNPHDLRRDMHTFVGYVNGRRVKRSYRNNQLPKADAKRIAKLMSHPDCLQHIEEDVDNASWWIDEVDSLALRLGFVSYDTEGEYAGYTSYKPSFRDNYIEYETEIYEAFLDMPLLEQEKRLFALLRTDAKHKELFHRHLQSSLNSFPGWGMATNVIPLLDFPQIRRFLFDLLAGLDSGKWYTTVSLIRYLQETHPYFLIPPKEKLPQKDQWNRRLDMKRYGNFYETQKGEYYHDKNVIPDDAPDGFERVEGRFIERFLEGIPLTLGYVDVAYDRKPYQGLMPERGTLQAFRVHGRFQQLMRDEAITPKVTILPNFEIHVESPFYAPGLMRQLRPFVAVVIEDKVSILKLEKQQVKAALAANDSLELIPLLQSLTGRPLPQNVAIELEEWGGQADTFTLYSDFALLEGDKRLPETEAFVMEQISPKLRLIRQPEKVFHALEQAKRAPLSVRHTDNRLAVLPAKARTLFPKQKATKARPKRKTKQRVTLRRETRLTLYAPTDAFYEQLRTELLKRRCIFEADQAKKSITYAQAYKPQVDAAIKALRQTYIIKFEDMAT
ncbi:MAG: hypothetical protein GY803_32455 [Chloroflexi bacterium]|nr:hypothetical protein [Chloroflexota bacterium]